MIEFLIGEIIMKRIYAFTLDGEDYPSSRFDSNLRLFAHMLYETVYSYDDVDNNPLNINRNIVYNYIHDLDGGSSYYFDSDINEITDKFINYEPFIVGSNTFCFTVQENLISKEGIIELVNYINRLLKLNYTVTINEFDYVSKDKDDERHRYKAIKTLFRHFDSQISYKNNFVRRLIYPRFNRRLV